VSLVVLVFHNFVVVCITNGFWPRDTVINYCHYWS